ncbi:hypothetical protein QOT17_019901 [Balamuthia mandrillaris]
MLSEFFFQLQPNHLNRGIEVRCSSRGDRAVQLQRAGFAEFMRERQVSLRQNENDDDLDNCLLSCHDASPPLGMAQWDLQLSPPGRTMAPMEGASTEAELCSLRREEDIQTREENELEMNWWLEEHLWGDDKSSTTSSSSFKQSNKRKRKETKQQANKKKTKKRHAKKKRRQDLPRTEFDIHQSCPLLKEAHAAITDMNSAFHQERAWANVLASAPVAPHPKDRLAKEHNFVTSVLANLRQRSSCRSVLAQAVGVVRENGYGKIYGLTSIDSRQLVVLQQFKRFAELHERLREYKRAVKNEYKLLKQKLQKDRRQLQQLRSTRPNIKTKLAVTCTLKGDTLS